MRSSLIIRKLPAAIACTAVILALAGCNKNAGVETSAAGATAAKKADEPTQQDYTRKLNAYTDSYNKLIGSFGLPETRKNYFEKQIANKSAKDDIFISAGWIDQALASLKQAQALPTIGAGELEKSAGQLIGTLEKLVAQLVELDLYYKAKAYKEDNLAKGKAKDPEVRAAFDASIAAMTAFDNQLKLEHKKREDKELAALKADGNLRLYHIKLGLQQAEGIIDLFMREDDLKDPQKFSQGDTLIAELEKTLAEQRKIHAEMQPKDANYMNHESVSSHLTAMVGAYRQMKQSKRTNDFNSMIVEYNRAVGSANSIGQ